MIMSVWPNMPTKPIISSPAFWLDDLSFAVRGVFRSLTTVVFVSVSPCIAVSNCFNVFWCFQTGCLGIEKCYVFLLCCPLDHYKCLFLCLVTYFILKPILSERSMLMPVFFASGCHLLEVSSSSPSLGVFVCLCGRNEMGLLKATQRWVLFLNPSCHSVPFNWRISAFTFRVTLTCYIRTSCSRSVFCASVALCLPCVLSATLVWW